MLKITFINASNIKFTRDAIDGIQRLEISVDTFGKTLKAIFFETLLVKRLVQKWKHSFNFCVAKLKKDKVTQEQQIFSMLGQAKSRSLHLASASLKIIIAKLVCIRSKKIMRLLF